MERPNLREEIRSRGIKQILEWKFISRKVKNVDLILRWRLDSLG